MQSDKFRNKEKLNRLRKATSKLLKTLESTSKSDKISRDAKVYSSKLSGGKRTT